MFWTSAIATVLAASFAPNTSWAAVKAVAGSARSIFALGVGYAVSLGVGYVANNFNSHILFPPSRLWTYRVNHVADFREDQQAYTAYLAALPTAAVPMAMAAHLSMPLVGGWLAARLAPTRPRLHAMIIGFLGGRGAGSPDARTFGVADIVSPWALWLLEAPLFLYVAWVAGTLELSRRDAYFVPLTEEASMTAKTEALQKVL